jgi:hypothetical protein
MSQTNPTASAGAPPLSRLGNASLAVGAIAALVLAARAASGATAWAPSYLAAWLFVLGISLGALALAIVQRLTGGGWGETVRPVLEASLRTLPVALVLSVPLMFRLPELFAWMQPGNAGAQGRAWYLSVPFFAVRGIACFVIWLALARLLRQERPPPGGGTTQGNAAVGFVLYALTATFASVDWIMSLTPEWHSTVFGLLIGVGQVMSALSLAIMLAAALGQRSDETLHQRFHDLGKLLFAMVLLWAYLAFMQFLIMWIEDLPADIGWYLPRTQTSWSALGLVLAAAHFVVPFLLLLSRELKCRPPLLAAVAAIVLFACLADALWLVLPSFRRAGLDLRWSDLLALLAVGGLWFGSLARAIQAPAATPALGQPGEGISTPLPLAGEGPGVRVSAS